MLILKLAWRNVWRNKRRSLVIVAVIFMTMLVTLTFRGLIKGILREGVNNAVDSHWGHLSVHVEPFHENFQLKYRLSRKVADTVEQTLAARTDVKDFAERVIGSGLISSARSSSGVGILGVDPGKEPKITLIKQLIKDGSYFTGADERAIVISRIMAKKLKVGVGDKLVLTVPTLSQEMGSELFRVKGIYATDSSFFDRAMVMIGIKNAQELFQVGDGISEIVIRFKNYSDLPSIRRGLEKKLSGKGLEFITWKEALPSVVQQIDAIERFLGFLQIVFCCVVFLGMASIFFMTIYERIREAGIMMAIGARPHLVFSLLVVESFLLSTIGVAAGLILSAPLLYYCSAYGINLSVFSSALKAWQVGNIVHFDLTFINIAGIALGLILTSVSAALYPAYRASRFDPVAAIHHV